LHPIVIKHIQKNSLSRYLSVYLSHDILNLLDTWSTGFHVILKKKHMLRENKWSSEEIHISP
jgi:hypothetical protein